MCNCQATSFFFSHEILLKVVFNTNQFFRFFAQCIIFIMSGDLAFMFSVKQHKQIKACLYKNNQGHMLLYVNLSQ